VVHFDLWDSNVFVQERDGRFGIEGVIDGECAFYGDPLAEFVALAVLRVARAGSPPNGLRPVFGSDGD
jgi:hypothetical protein